MITTADDLASLYQRYATRLTAHAAARLKTLRPDAIEGQVDDVTQDVWLWAGQQRRLPSWESLHVMTDWVIEGLIAERQARPEALYGLRPPNDSVLALSQGAPVDDLASTGPAVDEPLPLAA